MVILVTGVSEGRLPADRRGMQERVLERDEILASREHNAALAKHREALRSGGAAGEHSATTTLCAVSG